jgi:hypothetical protein
LGTTEEGRAVRGTPLVYSWCDPAAASLISRIGSVGKKDNRVATLSFPRVRTRGRPDPVSSARKHGSRPTGRGGARRRCGILLRSGREGVAHA